MKETRLVRIRRVRPTSAPAAGFESGLMQSNRPAGLTAGGAFCVLEIGSYPKPMPNPPTIADTRRHGIDELIVYCACGRQSFVEFDSLKLPEDTPFVEIKNRRHFTCEACKCRDRVDIRPHWALRMETNMGVSPEELQAIRDFAAVLIAEHGPDEALRIARERRDDRDYCEPGKPGDWWHMVRADVARRIRSSAPG